MNIIEYNNLHKHYSITSKKNDNVYELCINSELLSKHISIFFEAASNIQAEDSITVNDDLSHILNIELAFIPEYQLLIQRVIELIILIKSHHGMIMLHLEKMSINFINEQLDEIYRLIHVLYMRGFPINVINLQLVNPINLHNNFTSKLDILNYINHLNSLLYYDFVNNQEISNIIDSLN